MSDSREDMNRDLYKNNPMPDYMQYTELQPMMPYLQQHYGHVPSNAVPSTSYDMNAAGPSCSGGGPGAQGLPSTMQLAPHHDRHDNAHINDPCPQSSTSNYNEEYEAMSGCDAPQAASTSRNVSSTSSRKRKSSVGTTSAYDDDGNDSSRSSRTFPDKKHNHSEIEKRRRDKMNTYIAELSAIVPMCGAIARKLDKLTVLRMAVQHLKSVRGSLATGPLAACPRPSYVSERELNRLVLQAGRDCMVLVVGCDRGRLLYVSASVTNSLHYEQSDLLGQSLFDILHPKDVAKVKEQLSSSDLSPRERLIDAKTMLPVKAEVGAGPTRLCPGARRSFFCRIKCKTSMPHVKKVVEPNVKVRKKSVEKKYCLVQCTGYLKSWAPAEICEEDVCGEEDTCNLSCLVAIGRALPCPVPLSPSPDLSLTLAPVPACLRPLHFLSRHANDGKYLFVDQRVTLALGFLPQELLGTSLYEYVSGSELCLVARTHKAALIRRDALRTPAYSARRKDGSHTLLQTYFKPFRNPWTKDVDCLLAQNTIVTEAQAAEISHTYETSQLDGLNDDAGTLSACDVEVQRLIEAQVESHKIGSAIAEEARRRSPPGLALEIPPVMLQDAIFNNQPLVDNMLLNDINCQVRNNVPLGAAEAASPAQGGEDCARGAAIPTDSAPVPLDGNGEAAMAVIMSLLEADAGLGGPVNFSGLPWPLP